MFYFSIFYLRYTSEYIFSIWKKDTCLLFVISYIQCYDLWDEIWWHKILTLVKTNNISFKYIDVTFASSFIKYAFHFRGSYVYWVKAKDHVWWEEVELFFLYLLNVYQHAWTNMIIYPLHSIVKTTYTVLRNASMLRIK